MRISFKTLITITIWASSVLQLFSANPNWKVNKALFSQNMTITGVVNIYGSTYNRTGLIIAAFSNDICCGVSELSYLESSQTHLAFLMLHGNGDPDIITFKTYDPELDSIINLNNIINFKSNTIIGDPLNPYIWSKGLTSSDALMLSFSVPGQISTSVINDSSVIIKVSPTTNLNAVIPLFQASPAALVYKDSILQQSGNQSVDFSNNVTYTVVAENKTISRDYQIKLIVDSTFTSDLTLSNCLIEEDKNARTFVGTINRTTQTAYGGYSYSLSSRYSDNAYFMIKDDSLFSAVSFSINNREYYHISVKSIDYNGFVLEKTFEIQIVLNTSIAEASIYSENIRLYPTLISDKLTVDFKNFKSKNGTISIYNIKGQLISSYPKETETSSLELNCNSWQSGLYIVQFAYENKLIKHKIIKP